MGPQGEQAGDRAGQHVLATCARWGAVAGWRTRRTRSRTDGKAAKQVDVAAGGSRAQPAPRVASPASTDHTHPDDEAVTQRQLGLWQRLRVLHRPGTSTPRSATDAPPPGPASTTCAPATGAWRPGPAPAPFTREASRRRRRGATAPSPTASVLCQGT